MASVFPSVKWSIRPEVPLDCKHLWFAELSYEHLLPIKPKSILWAPAGAQARDLEPEKQARWVDSDSSWAHVADWAWPASWPGPSRVPATGLSKQPAFACDCSALPGGHPTCPLTCPPDPSPCPTFDLCVWWASGIPGRVQIPGSPLSGGVTLGKHLILCASVSPSVKWV